MNIVFDAFTNCVFLQKSGTKKSPEVLLKYSFKKPVKDYKSLLSELPDFLKSDEAKHLLNEQSNLLILPDFGVGFGTFEFPALSKRRFEDVFNTTFRMTFPNFNSFYYDHFEYSRNETNSICFYTLLKRDYITQVLDAFKSNGIEIKGINYFASAYTLIFENRTIYPVATLFMGSNYSEFIISKGDKVIASVQLPYGKTTILSKENYLISPYFVENDYAEKFAQFAIDNINLKEELNDVNILKKPAKSGQNYTLPKELRILKDTALEQYKIKNNVRKFVALILDVLETYAKAPYFLPIEEINVVSEDDFCDVLNSVELEDNTIKFKKKVFDNFVLLKENLIDNPLFATKVVVEKKKFDWSKFLSMEIGKKKKGMTLVETIVALSIILIISVAATSLAIFASNSFRDSNIKNHFKIQLDNIAKIFIEYDKSSDFSKAFNFYTGQTNNKTDQIYYLDSQYNFMNSSDGHSYSISLDFDGDKLTMNSKYANGSIIYEKEVTR